MGEEDGQVHFEVPVMGAFVLLWWPLHGSLNWTPVLPECHSPAIASDTHEIAGAIQCCGLEPILFLLLAQGIGRASAEAPRCGSVSLSLGITRHLLHVHSSPPSNHSCHIPQ